MTQATSSESSRLERIEQLVERNSIAIDKLTQDIAELRAESKETNTKFDAYVKASQAMTRMSTTIITAGIVTLLSLFLQSDAPTIRAFLGGSA
jgi:CHASE3 domain sensor protein